MPKIGNPVGGPKHKPQWAKDIDAAIDCRAVRGRPRIDASSRKSNNLTFRARGGLREQLRVAATKNERSVSEEIEIRLLLSFARDETGSLKG